MKKIIVLLTFLSCVLNAQYLNYDFDPIRIARGGEPGITHINKFGQNADVDTGVWEDIWGQGGTYTFSTTADIDRLSSSSAADTISIRVIGLDTNWLEVSQDITLTGQTPVALTTPLIRVYRMYNIGSTDVDGTVYCFVNTAVSSGVPSDATKIRAIIDDGHNQTLMAIYTVPAGKTAYFLQGYVGLSKSSTTEAAFELYVRPFGGVFRIQGSVGLSSIGSSYWIYKYAIPPAIPEKTDIKIRASSTANNTEVSAGFDMLLIDN